MADKSQVLQHIEAEIREDNAYVDAFLKADLLSDVADARSLNGYMLELVGIYNQISSGAVAADAGFRHVDLITAETRKLKSNLDWYIKNGKVSVKIPRPQSYLTPEIPKTPSTAELPMVTKSPSYIDPSTLDTPSLYAEDTFQPGGKVEVVEIPDEVKQIVASPNPVNVLTTPRPGTVPVAAGTSSWSDLIATLFGGYSAYKQNELLKTISRSPYLYVTPQTQYYVQQKKRLPWGWIGGGLGLLVLAGIGVFLFTRKK
jgi:hypothetical protein